MVRPFICICCCLSTFQLFPALSVKQRYVTVLMLLCSFITLFHNNVFTVILDGQYSTKEIKIKFSHNNALVSLPDSFLLP